MGVREAEEPHYDVVGRAGQVEIRQYPPRIAAEATVDGSEMQARSTGFRRLAGYIFGANSTSASVAMTAPVAQSRTIAMTAPVAQSRQDGGGWTIRFFMPAKYTMGTLPRPNDAAVKLVQVPAETMAVLRFSGSTAPQAVAEHGKLLMDAVATSRVDRHRMSGRLVLRPALDPAALPPQRGRGAGGRQGIAARGSRPAVLKLAAIVLTAASLGGLGLIAAYQWGPPRGRVWLPGAAHGLLGVAGTVLLAIGLQGPPRGAGMGMASFGLVSAGLAHRRHPARVGGVRGAAVPGQATRRRVDPRARCPRDARDRRAGDPRGLPLRVRPATSHPVRR